MVKQRKHRIKFCGIFFAAHEKYFITFPEKSQVLFRKILAFYTIIMYNVERDDEHDRSCSLIFTFIPLLLCVIEGIKTYFITFDRRHYELGKGLFVAFVYSMIFWCMGVIPACLVIRLAYILRMIDITENVFVSAIK